MDPTIGAEPRGDNVALFDIDAAGNRQEMVISSGAALQLSRLLPSLLRKIAADMLPIGPGRSVSAAVPIVNVGIVEDVHHTEVLLNIKDQGGGDFDYSISPNYAKKVGQALIARANYIDQENAKKIGH